MNNNFTKETIEKLADLLEIGLSEDEANMVLEEFDVIDKNINKITSIPELKSIEPMTHALDEFEYILREDEAKEPLKIDDILKNAGKTSGDEIEVLKVVG